MSKPVVRKNSLRLYYKRECILICVTPDVVIINHSITMNYIVKKCNYLTKESILVIT